MDLEANGQPDSEAIRRLEEEHRHYSEKLETLLQKLVSGINLQFMKDGYKGDAQNDHGQRQAEIELHKAHPVGISLARRR